MDRDSVNSDSAPIPARRFDAVAVLDAVDPAIVPPARRIDTTDHSQALGDSGPLDVDAAIGWARRRRNPRERVLILTSRDLYVPELGSLFGFADRKHGVAIVSTCRLSAADAAQSRRRAANAIAHEAGHLDGLRHCAQACLMRPAANATDLDTRPDSPCGRCPRGASLTTKTVLALTTLLLLIAVVSRIIEFRPPQRVAPALPPAISAALAELPRDTDDVFGRPVTVVARANVTAGAPPVLLTPAVLPAGVSASLLSSLGASITSATFRTPNAVPIAYVHAITTRGPAVQLTTALGCARPDGREAYATCRVDRDGTEVYAITARQAQRVTMVFSPHETGRDMAARLASAIGASAGVWRDRDLNALIGTLPAVLPQGYTLDTLIASNVHRIPESVDELTTALLGEDLAGGAAELTRVMPLAIEAATYRNVRGHELTVMVGDYGSTLAAWLAHRSIRSMVQPWAIGVTNVGRHEAIQLASATRHGLLFRRGQLVAAVHGPSSGDTESLIRELANALQP